MTKDFKIPATIEAAQKALDGLGQLLTAKEWERAAIVYAFTEPQPGRRNLAGKPARLSFTDFAALGISGLRNRDTVAIYRQHWQTAIDDGQAQPVEPGQTTGVPSRDFPPTKTGGPESGITNVIAAIERNPTAVAEALRDRGGKVADALIEVDPGGRFERNVQSAHYKRPGEREVHPRPHVERDYDADLRYALSRIVACAEAARAGEWEPDAGHAALLHFSYRLMGELTGGERVPDELFDEIHSHLEAART